MARFTGIRSQLLGLVAAAVVPFLVLIGAGLWNQSRTAQAEAKNRALAEARVLAAQFDDHIGNLENLMLGLSRVVSTDPADAAANDALLSGLKAELPSYISDIVMARPEGEIIGSAFGRRYAIGDRTFFQQVEPGQSITVGSPFRARADGRWIFPVLRPIRNAAGELQGVLIVGTFIEAFRGALRVSQLPAGSIVRIVSDTGIAVASFPEVPDWVGRDLSKADNAARRLRTREGSEIATWADNVTRITGYSTAYRAPWLVTIGMPMEVASAAVAAKLKWSGLFGLCAIAIGSIIAWMLSGRIIRPLRQLEQDAAILAAGELSHRTSISAAGEFGKLADAFNQMASSIERRRNERLEHANVLQAAGAAARARRQDRLRRFRHRLCVVDFAVYLSVARLVATAPDAAGRAAAAAAG